MVRCEEFYKEYEKKGNFCGKSNEIVKKVEEYMSYMKRYKFGDFLISNCAIEPFIRIEYLKDGVVHRYALKELRKKVKRLGARGITRKISIETINYANGMVSSEYKIESIPEVRNRMGTFEHTIENVSSEVREQFNDFKKKWKLKDNNIVILEMLHWSDSAMDENKKWIERGNKKDSLRIVSVP